MDDMELPTGLTCGDCANWRKCTALIDSIDPTSITCDWSPSRFSLNPVKYLALADALEAAQAELCECRNDLANARDERNRELGNNALFALNKANAEAVRLQTAENARLREALVFAGKHMPQFGEVSGYEYDLECSACGSTRISSHVDPSTGEYQYIHMPDCELVKWFAFVKTLEPRP